MINNPNMLKETLENFNKVPDEVIKETIKEVLMNDKEAKIILEDIKNTYKYCYKNNNAKQISINVDYQIAEAIEIVLNLIEKQKERIEYLERSISRKEHSLVEEEQDNVELETKLKEKDKIIDLMAEDKYEYIDMLQMAKIGKEINYDPIKLFNGISDEEAVKIIKQYFENKVKESK